MAIMNEFCLFNRLLQAHFRGLIFFGRILEQRVENVIY